MNLIGQKIGLLTVLKLDEVKVKETGQPYWVCQCECGKIITKRQDQLRRATDTIKSCGCQSYKNRGRKKENLVGHTFGRLTVLEEDLEGKARTSRICWKCKCECGKEVTVRADYLKSGATKSCGCLKSSFGERKISYLLNEMNIPYVKEYTFTNLKGDNANLRFDFAIIENDKIKCLIEYQGEQHYKENSYFGGEERFKKRQEYDGLKRKYCEKNKIKLVEIPYWELEEINEEYLKRYIT